MIRNFAIIAHIDSGKTTLTDRFLQFTHTVAQRDFHERILDANPIEQERGVTIKLAPVTMNYQLDARRYTLNLIDTPGHVDFAYEVDRSLAACEGAILLIDGTRGIQAQTLSVAHKAVNLGLHLIPAINKIDLSSAHVPDCLKQLHDVFGFKPEEISLVSAKTGQGVSELLARVITDIPAPQGAPTSTLRALIFNSTYDEHLGVIAFVRIVDGSLKSKLALTTLQTHQTINPKEIGIFIPSRQSTPSLSHGQVGYIATGLKSIQDLKVGDTLSTSPTTPLPGYQAPQPVVFVNAYPAEDTDYRQLVDAVTKLKLSDASLTVKPVHSAALGPGLRLGCLGLFHIDITRERLEREHHLHLILTPPTVDYHIDPATGAAQEPWVKITLITPPEFIGPLMHLFTDHRGTYTTTTYFGNQAQLTYHLPLAELISGLVDQVKSASQGYASFDYEPLDYQPVDIVKLDILVHHQPVDALSRLVVRSQAVPLARRLVAKLKDILPPQQFAVPIQAAIGPANGGAAGHIIARETKPALRKDVTAKLYGGDQTRKDKLLKKQKKGKKLLAQTASVHVPGHVLTQLATI